MELTKIKNRNSDELQPPSLESSVNFTILSYSAFNLDLESSTSCNYFFLKPVTIATKW